MVVCFHITFHVHTDIVWGITTCTDGAANFTLVRAAIHAGHGIELESTVGEMGPIGVIRTCSCHSVHSV